MTYIKTAPNAVSFQRHKSIERNKNAINKKMKKKEKFSYCESNEWNESAKQF